MVRKLWAKALKRPFAHHPPYISARPALYYPFLKALHRARFHDCAVKRDSEIVVEAPHRSANTYLGLRLRESRDPPVRVAMHCHASAQIIQALRWKIPAIVVLRRPDDQIRSHVVFNWGMTPTSAAKQYYRFYEALWPYRDEILILSFEEVTADLSAVAARINKRFGTAFALPSQPDEDFKARTDLLNAETGLNAPFRSHFPSVLKEAAKSKVELDPENPRLKRCWAIYERFAEQATSQRAAETATPAPEQS